MVPLADSTEGQWSDRYVQLSPTDCRAGVMEMCAKREEKELQAGHLWWFRIPMSKIELMLNKYDPKSNWLYWEMMTMMYRGRRSVFSKKFRRFLWLCA